MFGVQDWQQELVQLALSLTWMEEDCEVEEGMRESRIIARADKQAILLFANLLPPCSAIVLPTLVSCMSSGVVLRQVFPHLYLLR